MIYINDYIIVIYTYYIIVLYKLPVFFRELRFGFTSSNIKWVTDFIAFKLHIYITGTYLK